MIKRTLDLVVALSAAVIFAIPSKVIMTGVRLSSMGPVLHCSRRAWRRGQFFMMPKFRSMRNDTPEFATGKLIGAGTYITPFWSFLRRTSLDELPQIYSVSGSRMGIVGMRPALHDQHELIAKRAALGVDQLRPGVIRLAQINGRDEIALQNKLRLHQDYLELQSLFFDPKIIMLTLVAVVRSRGMLH